MPRLRPILFLVFVLKLSIYAASQTGYNYCMSTANPVLLSAGGRCLTLESTRYFAWDDAMARCNELGGYLYHVYSSADLAKLIQWAPSAGMTYGSWCGFKKQGPLGGNYTGYNVKWLLTSDHGLPVNLDSQCGSCIDNGASADSKVHCASWLHYNFVPPNLGRIYVETPTHAQHLYAICEFASVRNPYQVEYIAHFGKVSPAAVLEESIVTHEMFCSIKCSPTFYCQGYNVVGTEPNLLCQLIGQAIEDTVMQALVDSSDGIYYERKQ